MKPVKIGRTVLKQQMTKEGALRVARLLMTDGLYERGYSPRVKSTRKFYKIQFIKGAAYEEV